MQSISGPLSNALHYIFFFRTSHVSDIGGELDRRRRMAGELSLTSHCYYVGDGQTRTCIQVLHRVWTLIPQRLFSVIHPNNKDQESWVSSSVVGERYNKILDMFLRKSCYSFISYHVVSSQWLLLCGEKGHHRVKPNIREGFSWM